VPYAGRVDERVLCRAPAGAESARSVANEALLVHLRAVRVETHETYGSPRMHAELVARGQPCSMNRVARLMRLSHLPARHKRPYHPKTTCPDPTRAVVPNRLAQDFTADAPNQKWVGDITYIPTSQGWLYLAAVLDLHSRRVVGWALEQTMTTDLVCAALEMALGRRQPAAGLLHHTDRGSQYTSTAYQDVLTVHGLVASLSSTGHCYDNAPMESFFGTLKAELICRTTYATRAAPDRTSFRTSKGSIMRRASFGAGLSKSSRLRTSHGCGLTYPPQNRGNIKRLHETLQTRNVARLYPRHIHCGIPKSVKGKTSTCVLALYVLRPMPPPRPSQPASD
jgi:putative transposase